MVGRLVSSSSTSSSVRMHIAYRLHRTRERTLSPRASHRCQEPLLIMRVSGMHFVHRECGQTRGGFRIDVVEWWVFAHSRSLVCL